MPYKRSLGCRQAFRTKNKIAKTPANQFLHIFPSPSFVLLCNILFFWGPWKLYGLPEYYQLYYIVAGVWVVNLLWSALWLRRFQFGPAEWLWRSLTYWKIQPLLAPAPAERGQ
jgi:hypothetical protein